MASMGRMRFKRNQLVYISGGTAKWRIQEIGDGTYNLVGADKSNRGQTREEIKDDVLVCCKAREEFLATNQRAMSAVAGSPATS